MRISFNHTVIAAKDRESSAQFYVDLAEAHRIESWGPFTHLQLDDGVMLQFAEPPIDFPPQHYAFLVDDEHFERTHARIQEHGIEHWADPQRTRPGQTNTEHGGRGVYLLDPAGHYLEFITRPYLQRDCAGGQGAVRCAPSTGTGGGYLSNREAQPGAWGSLVQFSATRFFLVEKRQLYAFLASTLRA